MIKTEPSSPKTTPTKRGLPPRTRRPNPWIYDEQDDEPPHLRAGAHSAKSSRKQSKQRVVQVSSDMQALINNYSDSSSPSKQAAAPGTPTKKSSQNVGIRLKNMLKLPKAHRWVCYEWFYANIDIPLLQRENDFCSCLKESFPQLKTHKLTRPEWCKIRRLMGKPRRCSAAFLREERQALQVRRDKVRMLQQRKDLLTTDFQDLPEDIPMSLVIGTKVTARICYPVDGIFTGIIDAVDPLKNAYRITFEKPGIGSHVVPDINVLSDSPPESIPLSAFISNQRKRQQPALPMSPIRYNSSGLTVSSTCLVTENDPLLGSSPLKANLSHCEEGTYGGFPIKFLSTVSRLTKVLLRKRKKVRELKDLNTEAEKMSSYGEDFPGHFQQTYASVVLELEEMNRELNLYLDQCQQYCGQLAEDPTMATNDQGEMIKLQADAQAKRLVAENNKGTYGKKMVRNEHCTDLIEKLTSLMLQIKSFAENDMPSFEFRSIQESLNEIKNGLDPSNRLVFQNHVEIHINHIQSGLCMTGNLQAFHSNPAS